MKSQLPKVLHSVSGRPLLEHVLDTAKRLRPSQLAVVVGVSREQIKKRLSQDGWKGLHYIVQEKPRGSGDAVLRARSWLRGRKGTLLVVYGDTPLLKAETLKQL